MATVPGSFHPQRPGAGTQDSGIHGGGHIRTVFVQPDPANAREQWQRVIDNLRPSFPRLAQLLEKAEDDVLAYLAFPSEHWRQI